MISNAWDIMKQIVICIALLLLLACPSVIQAKSDGDIFAKVVAPDSGRLYRGDSTVVSVYVYSRYPISSIDIDDKRLRVAGCEVRKLYARKRQSVTRINGQTYYTVLGALYSVASDKKGKTHFPQLSLTANLLVEQEDEGERRADPFFGPFDDFFRQPSYKKVKRSIRTPLYKMEVTDAPRKTMRELQRSGKTII